MTKEEAIEAISKLDASGPECTHIDADQILLAFLSDNGFEDVARAWSSKEQQSGFWYA